MDYFHQLFHKGMVACWFLSRSPYLSIFDVSNADMNPHVDFKLAALSCNAVRIGVGEIISFS